LFALDNRFGRSLRSLASAALSIVPKLGAGQHVAASAFLAEAVQLLRWTVKGGNRRNCLAILAEMELEIDLLPEANKPTNKESSLFFYITQSCRSLRRGALRLETAITLLEVVFRLMQAASKELVKVSKKQPTTLRNPERVIKQIQDDLAGAFEVPMDAICTLQGLKADVFRAAVVECKLRCEREVHLQARHLAHEAT
jgi:exonuclease VII small subunit